MTRSATAFPYDIPSHCLAGVVVNEGPDFRVEIETVPVPEPGTYCSILSQLC